MTEPYISEEIFDRHLAHIRDTPVVAIDTEGTLNHPHSETWGLSYSARGVSEYFGFNHKYGNNLPGSWVPKLAETVASHPCLIFHHAKHDLKALRNLGIDYKGKFYDTMLMSHMVDENTYSQDLDSVSKKYGGPGKNKSETMEKVINAFGWPAVSVEMMRDYGDNDAVITEQAYEQMLPIMQAEGLDGELWDTEQKLCRFLVNMENQGVLINTSLAEQELERGTKIMEDLSKDLGFNPGSTTQLGKFLIDELGLPIVKRSKKTNKPSFDKKAMEVYDELLALRNDKRAQQILVYRGWAKTTSSNYRPYLELSDHTGRLRANFKQHGTVTGRLSCEKPNLQQLPRSSSKDWNGHLKSAFIVESGRIAYEFDYSQLELRLGAAYGKVPQLIDIFNDPSRDIFTEMSKDLGMSRDNTKTLVYTLQYGGGIDRLSTVFGVSSLAAKAIRDGFFRKYSGLHAITQLASQKCRDQGYIKYWTGRRRHFRYPDSEDYKAFSSLIQGGGFEIVKRAMIAVDEAGLNNDECRIDLQVHDSIRADIEKGKEHIYIPEIIRAMEKTPDFGVEFRVQAKEWAKAA